MKDSNQQTDDLSERMRFNCFQISPCISSIINAPLLPHTKTKTINYSLDKSYLNKTRTFVQLYEYFQRKLQHQTKKPSKSLPKISSFHVNNENFINENVKIDSVEKATKLFNHMKDLSKRLKKQEQRYSTLNSAKQVFEYAKRQSNKNDKIPMETETLEQKPKTPETILKPIIKLAQIDEKINKSFRFEKDGNNNFNDLKDKSQFSSALLWPADQNETGVKSQLTAFTKQRSKSNLKVINEKDLQRSHEKLQAHVFENGETVDINEGLKNKVRTYFMLNVDGMDNGILEQKDRKREYIKRYAKYINENIDENIRGINVKLEKLNKVKVNSFHR